MTWGQKFSEAYDQIIFDPIMREYFGAGGFYNAGYWQDGTASPDAASLALTDRMIDALPKDARIIADIGCGLGATTLRLAQRHPQSQIVAVNFSHPQLQAARARCPRALPLLSDAARLAFASSSIDAILSVEAALHFNTRADFFAEAFRTLRPGGVLAMTDILFRDPRWPGQWTVPDGNSAPDLGSYRSALAAAGFVDIRIDDAFEPCWGAFCRNMKIWADRRATESPHAPRVQMSFEDLYTMASHYPLVVARKPDSTPALAPAIDAALGFLAARQLPDGEFQTEFRYDRRTLDDGTVVDDLMFDSSPFVTSLVTYALSFVRPATPAAADMIRRACDFLASEMEPGGLWRYWSRKNERRAMIPPDLDDTSCISHTLALNGRPVPDNRWLFHDSRDPRGLFYTWLYRADSWRKWWLNRRTKRQAFSYQDTIWQWTAKDDVCFVVNANVLLYLGANGKTRRAIAAMHELIKTGQEDKGIVFYNHRLSLYYMLSRAMFCGVQGLSDLVPLLLDRIAACRMDDGSYGDPLRTGLAICSRLNLGDGVADLDTAVQSLLAGQRADGSWPRVPMYGGPPVPDTFGSANITTAMVLEALIRFQAAAAGHPMLPAPMPHAV